MKELLESLKERYDVVLVDTAPLLLVSDTMPLLQLSDLVVYVSRAQYSDKNIFPFIKELQNACANIKQMTNFKQMMMTKMALKSHMGDDE